jgi:hypothetical protein
MVVKMMMTVVVRMLAAVTEAMILFNPLLFASCTNTVKLLEA